MLIEELLDCGVLLTGEQIDFLHHPENRLAVAVYGVPDPDRLYISGPVPALYQQAPPGEPADANGMAACIIPVVFQGGNQEELARVIADWEGDFSEDIPQVHGYPEGTDFMYSWTSDEIPISVACWDLWPIATEEVHAWVSVASQMYWSSAIPAMFELIEQYQGSDYKGPRGEELDTQMEQVASLARKISKEEEDGPVKTARLAELEEQFKSLEEEQVQETENYFLRLEKQIVHPVSEEVDAQMPPADLPPEQAAIWRSLQSLSWRNWSTLHKADQGNSDALYGSPFVQANRRLCPWY